MAIPSSLPFRKIHPGPFELVVFGHVICGYGHRVKGSLETLDDASLVAAITSGEVRAWNGLVDRYAQLIWSVGRRCGLPESESEDLVQTVFTITIQSIEQLEDSSALGGWILMIAKREAWRQSARWRRQRSGHPALEHEIAEEDVDRIGEGVERQQAVRTAFKKLGARCRGFIQNLFSSTEVPSYQHLADEFDVKLNSVGPIRRRCLDELQVILVSEFPELFQET